MEFKETLGGIIIAQSPAEPVQPAKSEWPVLADWHYTKCGERYHKSDDIQFRKEALEALYIAVSPGGGRVVQGEDAVKRDRLKRLIDQLAVELVGGVPAGYDEYC